MTTLEAPLGAAATLRPPASLPRAALVEPSVEVCAGVLELLESHGYEVYVARDLDEVIDAALALVEADRGARTIDLLRRLIALRPDLPVACVLPWWDDDEAEALRLARYILHVPLRDDQLQGLAHFADAVLPQPAAI